MSKEKQRFTTFLEFATGAMPNAFSSQILSQVPNVRDEDEDDEDNDPEKLERLKKKIKQRPTQDYPDDHADADQALMAVLKSFLHTDDEEPPHDDHPAEVDHDEMEDIDAGDGEESELNPDNIGPFNAYDDGTNDMPHAGETADHEYEDEKHGQLLAAINDLRDELRTARSQQPEKKKNGIRVTRMQSPPAEPAEEENEESYEEDQAEDTKQAAARQLFTGLINQGKSRQEIIDQFQKQIGVTDSTATSYYQRLAKEAGLTTSGDRELGPQAPTGLGVAAPMEPQTLPGPGGQGGALPEPESNVKGVEVEGDPNRQGLIRTVKGAHLVYKRKNEEGTFDELWVFGTGGDMKDTLQVRRAILAGTDIPPRALKSQDGSQSYTLSTMGNGQILNIKGLPN